MRIARASTVSALWILALAPASHAQTPPSTPPPAVTPPPSTTPPGSQPPAPTPAPAAPARTGTITQTAPVGPAGPAPYAPPAAVMERVLGRALSVEEAVAIALETQPQIQQRLADYQAAAFRVDEALSPLLPQLTSQVSSFNVTDGPERVGLPAHPHR